MKSIEVEEKTVDEAINKALEQLQVNRDQVSVEILDEGSRGLFGFMGTRPARIRVSISQPPAYETPKEELKSPRQNTPWQNQQIPPPEEKTSVLESASSDENVQQIIAAARHALQSILQPLQIDYTTEVSTREDQILFNIHCENENFLIGRRGATLDAIQYLVNRIANKHAGTKIQVVLDTSEYRVKRNQRLEKLAVRLSHKVKRTGKAVTVPPMNPHDRRIIHLALQDDPAVKTLSRGDGFMRKIIILASKNSGRNHKKTA
jgi:spoIIIJ-associated protein